MRQLTASTPSSSLLRTGAPTATFRRWSLIAQLEAELIELRDLLGSRTRRRAPTRVVTTEMKETPK
jgi:hypothetical protein